MTRVACPILSSDAGAAERPAGWDLARPALIVVGCAAIVVGCLLPWGSLGGFEQGAPASPTLALAVALAVVAPWRRLGWWPLIVAVPLLASLARDVWATVTTDVPLLGEMLFGAPEVEIGLVLAVAGGLAILGAYLVDAVRTPSG